MLVVRIKFLLFVLVVSWERDVNFLLVWEIKLRKNPYWKFILTYGDQLLSNLPIIWNIMYFLWWSHKIYMDLSTEKEVWILWDHSKISENGGKQFSKEIFSVMEVVSLSKQTLVSFWKIMALWDIFHVLTHLNKI